MTRPSPHHNSVSGRVIYGKVPLPSSLELFPPHNFADVHSAGPPLQCGKSRTNAGAHGAAIYAQQDIRTECVDTLAGRDDNGTEIPDSSPEREPAPRPRSRARRIRRTCSILYCFHERLGLAFPLCPRMVRDSGMGTLRQTAHIHRCGRGAVGCLASCHMVTSEHFRSGRGG